MKSRFLSRFKVLSLLVVGIVIVWLLLLLLLRLLPVGIGPGGMGDWAYDRLPNGYEIWRLNSSNIQVVKESGSIIILDGYVLEFCCNDSYIGIKHISTDEMISQKQADTKDLDTSNPEYYLIDAQNDAVYGPFTANDYQNQLEICQIQNMCDWIPTVPAPDGAKA